MMAGTFILKILVKKNQKIIKKAREEYKNTKDEKFLEKIKKHEKIVKDLNKTIKRFDI